MYMASRRIISAFLLVLLEFTACIGFSTSLGCAPRSRAEELFFYRLEEVTAEVTLTCNGSASAFVYRGSPDSCRVTFTAPDELCGFAIESDSEGGRITVDGLTAPAPDALCAAPNITRRIFTLSPDDVTSIETAPHPDNEGEKVTVVTADGITVALDRNGLPIRAEGALFGIGFQAEITDFSVCSQS